ncbi:uncharacterized protein BDV14DRAFT_163715 [Aspergillus stella-maris]|uniref:uncharacterized protein n=1 Tax=Aspergillus stella-maris TaxID=1810926 RepID=UPI003CCE2EAD
MQTEPLRDWFRSWYSIQANTAYETIDKRLLFRSQGMFPCFEFDDAEGMLATTRDLVYNRREGVRESNATSIKEPHLPVRISRE